MLWCGPTRSWLQWFGVGKIRYENMILSSFLVNYFPAPLLRELGKVLRPIAWRKTIKTNTNPDQLSFINHTTLLGQACLTNWTPFCTGHGMTVVIVSVQQNYSKHQCHNPRKQGENTIITKRYRTKFFCIFFLENITLGENFSVELTFRTSTRDGLLFVMLGNSTTEAGELIRCPKLCLIRSQQIKNRERMRVSYLWARRNTLASMTW